MIADDTPRGGGAPQGWRVSRRGFLALAAASMVAGCAPTGNSAARPTASLTPKPLVPSTRVEPGNAAQIMRLATFSPQDDDVRAVAWSPDGRVVAAGARAIHVWDVTTGEQVGMWHGHTQQIYGLAWSAASGMLASASADGSVRIWDTQHGTTVMILGGSESAPVYSLAWSPDGSKVVSGSKDGTVMLWDATTGKKLATWIGPATRRAMGPNPFAVWGVSWSPDGRRVVSTRYDEKVLVWDVQAGKELAVLTLDSQPNGVTWSPDGAVFAMTDDNGLVSLWDAKTYGNMARLDSDEGADGWAFGVGWTPDGGVLAAVRDAGSIQLWDTRAKTRLASLHAHGGAIWTMAWSPDGLRLATGSDDTTVRIWGVR